MVGLLVPKLSDQSDENEGPTIIIIPLNIAKARLASGGENVRLKANAGRSVQGARISKEYGPK
jgi:hypothetical protein